MWIVQIPLEYTDKLVCTLTGVEADSSMECDKAVSVGSQQPKEMIRKNFADLKLQINRKVCYYQPCDPLLKY